MNELITATEALSKLYGPLFVEDAPNWVRKNELVINYARKSNLVVGGSIAMAVTRKKVVKIPGDLDFFTNYNDDAMSFLTVIMNYLHKKPGSHYRVFVNNQTKFTLPGVISHYRLVGPPYWLPICVMVLEQPLRYFYYHGLAVQYFDDVVAAAKDVTKRDGKERVDVDPIVWKDAQKKTFTVDFADDFPDLLCGGSTDSTNSNENDNCFS